MSIVLIPYYKIALSHSDADGATDYKYYGNQSYYTGVEGYGSGRTNNDGYNNLYDWNENTDLDVLIIGGSHMEALQMPMELSASAQLMTLLGEDRKVYDLGMTGHQFLVCADNMPAALSKYQPFFVILETTELIQKDEDLMAVIDGTRDRMTLQTDTLYNLFRADPFLRLAAKQAKTALQIKNAADDMDDDIAVDALDETDGLNCELTRQLLNKLSKEAEENGAKLIIVYHSPVNISGDTDKDDSKQKTIEQFQEICEENDITFCNMLPRFQKEYEENEVLPYGFQNTVIGSGHLNRDGHRMMAEELYSIISELENDS